jgi:hypothetical protein
LEIAMTIGILAQKYCKLDLAVQVLSSNAGFYLGTIDDEGPCTRESAEYWRNRKDAEQALATGRWTQRPDV